MPKKNIKNEFKAIKFWPFNSKTMDDKTILINAYTTTLHTWYEKDDNSDTFHDNQQGGGGGSWNY
jgi:hypothetical protein